MAARPRATAKRSAPRRELRPQDGGLRRDLIAAALELVEVSGTRGLSWREVARRADVSQTAPYRHFANKEELLAAVAEQGFRRLSERMLEEMAAAPGDAARQLEAMAVAYLEFAVGNPAHFRVMFGRDVPDIGKHPALKEAHAATNGLFAAGVARVIERAGQVGVQLDPEPFTLMAWSLVHGLACLTIDGRVGDVGDAGLDPGEQLRSMTSQIKSMVRTLKA